MSSHHFTHDYVITKYSFITLKCFMVEMSVIKLQTESTPTTPDLLCRSGCVDKLRRSMPNLIRAPSMPSVPSMPCLASPINPPSHGPSSLPTISSLRSSQSFDSSNGLARLQSSSKTLFQNVCGQRTEYSCFHTVFSNRSLAFLVPSPGQLSQRVQSVGNFPTAPRHPLKATAYVSPTVQQGPTSSSSSLSTSVSLHSIPGSPALTQPLKPSSSLVPQPLKVGGTQTAVPRSSLPRPASFIGTSGVPRPSKIGQPTRR